ncbi:MAG: Tad domain-containing protein [Selenomonadaceae bacterium]|nr:Tad domain-containing protein [Selenomonadaceae bacterium]
MLKKNMKPQKGQILVLTVIMLPLLLIMTIFIIEAGFLYVKQSQLQNAADAIAVAGIASNTEEAMKLVKMNRTVDFDEKREIRVEFNPVKLTEPVIPIFGKLFGETEITKIEVYGHN